MCQATRKLADVYNACRGANLPYSERVRSEFVADDDAASPIVCLAFVIDVLIVYPFCPCWNSFAFFLQSAS